MFESLVLFIGKCRDSEDMVTSFGYGCISGLTSEVLPAISRKIRASSFNLKNKSSQREILNQKVFKHGNYHKSWTWKTYKSTDEFADYLDKGSCLIGYANDVFWGGLSKGLSYEK